MSRVLGKRIVDELAKTRFRPPTLLSAQVIERGALHRTAAAPDTRNLACDPSTELTAIHTCCSRTLCHRTSRKVWSCSCRGRIRQLCTDTRSPIPSPPAPHLFSSRQCSQNVYDHAPILPRPCPPSATNAWAFSFSNDGRSFSSLSVPAREFPPGCTPYFFSTSRTSS